MKKPTFIPAVLFSLISVNALADRYTCQTISGSIARLSPDPACHILQTKQDHFPAVKYVAEISPQAPDSCFSGQFTAALGDGQLA